MAQAFNSFDASPLGAFIRSALGARGLLSDLESGYPPGDIYIGGLFTLFDGVSTTNLIKYDLAGDIWSAENAGVGEVMALIAFNKQIIAGGLAGINNVTGSDPGTSIPTDDIYGLVILDGVLYAFGETSQASGTPVLKKWTGSGAWSSVSIPANVQSITGGVAIDDILYCRGTYNDGTQKGFIGKYDPALDEWTIQAHIHITVIDYTNHRRNVCNHQGVAYFANGTFYNTDYGQLFTWNGEASGGITKLTGTGGARFFGNSGGAEDVDKCFSDGVDLYVSGWFDYWDYGGANETTLIGIAKRSGSEFVAIDDPLPVSFTAREMSAFTILNSDRVLVGFESGQTEVAGIDSGGFYEFTDSIWSLFESSTGIDVGSTGAKINAIVDGGDIGVYVLSIDPDAGSIRGGQSATVTGLNFTSTTTIKVDGVIVSSSFVDSETIEITLPAHAAGAVDITAEDQAGQDTHTLAGAYTFEEIEITSINPVSGTIAGGTSVEITGKYFISGTQVEFDGTPATSIVINSSTSITCNTPAHAVGAVDVVVTYNAETDTLAGGYTYTDGRP